MRLVLNLRSPSTLNGCVTTQRGLRRLNILMLNYLNYVATKVIAIAIQSVQLSLYRQVILDYNTKIKK
jgi:hypothetical protein